MAFGSNAERGGFHAAPLLHWYRYSKSGRSRSALPALSSRTRPNLRGGDALSLTDIVQGISATDLLLLAVRYHFCYHFAPLSQYQFFLVASLHRVALAGGPGLGCVAFVLSVQAGLGLR